MTGIELIAQERKEQIEKHKRTIKSDVDFNSQKIYGLDITPLILQTIRLLDPTMKWEIPHFDKKITKKMEDKPYFDKLIIAGALIAAEIDRIQNYE